MSGRFRQLLESKDVIVFDGAMGTMLFNHGVFINRCFDELNLTNPELVAEVHRSYLAAGAMVLETNTFGADPVKLASFGLAGRTREINAAGTRIAKVEARDKALVAGSVGPLGLRIEPWGKTSLAEARAAFSEQIRGLIEGGVDAILLETFTDLAEMREAIIAARETCAALGHDIPVLASMTVDATGSSLYGTEPEIFGPQIESFGADVVGVNCSVGPKPMLETLERLIKVTTKPLLVMPNAGRPTDVDGRTIYVSTPDYMANYARRFVQLGARLVGGCCGTTPDHIRAIAASMRQVSSEQRSFTAPRSVPPRLLVELAPEVPFALRSALARKLADAKFVASVELSPPAGWELTRVVKNAQAAKDAGFDAINIPDGPRATARMVPLAMGVVIEREVGIETVMHYACRDRNLVGMQADLLGAYTLGLRNILVITGDPPILGDYPSATPVFDVDAIGLTNMVTRLNRGLDLGGRSIGKATGFCVLVGLNPTAINPDKERDRFRWKVDAGAHAAITQPVFDAEQLERFLDQLDQRCSIPLLAGIWPLASLRNAEFLANEVPGVSVPPRLLERMAAAKERDAEQEEGERIAIEILERVFPRVRGVQIAAPFGRLASAIRVLGRAQELARMAAVLE